MALPKTLMQHNAIKAPNVTRPYQNSFNMTLIKLLIYNCPTETHFVAQPYHFPHCNMNLPMLVIYHYHTNTPDVTWSYQCL